MSSLFHEMTGEDVIIIRKGLFKQVPVAIRKGELYAKNGTGYVRLLDNGKTSIPSLWWEDLTVDGYRVGRLGRLEYGDKI